MDRTSTLHPQKHVLYVEDNEPNRRLMSRIVSTLPDVALHLAKNANEALKAVDDIQFDLILLDLRLPGPSGYEIFKELKNRQDLAKVPVYAISADAMAHDQERAEQAGFTKFIPKPLDIRCFSKILTRQLNLGA